MTDQHRFDALQKAGAQQAASGLSRFMTVAGARWLAEQVGLPLDDEAVERLRSEIIHIAAYMDEVADV